MNVTWARDLAGLKLLLDGHELGAVYPSDATSTGRTVYWGCAYQYIGAHCATELEAARQLAARYGLISSAVRLPPPLKRGKR